MQTDALLETRGQDGNNVRVVKSAHRPGLGGAFGRQLDDHRAVAGGFLNRQVNMSKGTTAQLTQQGQIAQSLSCQRPAYGRQFFEAADVLGQELVACHQAAHRQPKSRKPVAERVNVGGGAGLEAQAEFLVGQVQNDGFVGPQFRSVQQSRPSVGFDAVPPLFLDGFRFLPKRRRFAEMDHGRFRCLAIL
jgi:hypothetical protein